MKGREYIKYNLWLDVRANPPRLVSILVTAGYVYGMITSEHKHQVHGYGYGTEGGRLASHATGTERGRARDCRSKFRQGRLLTPG